MAGEGLLSFVAGATLLLYCYPHFWWLLRERTLVRLTDVYRPGDYGGTLFLIARSLEEETGYRSQLLGHPVGFPFGGDFSNQLVTDLMAALVRIAGMPLGYNLWVVGMLASNGVAVHLAARLAGARPLPALVAGLTGAVTPLVVEEILSGRPVSSWWAPALAATALCVASLRSWRRLWLAVPGVLCLYLSVKLYAYSPVLLLPWTALAGVAALWPLRRGRFARAAIVLGVAGGVAYLALRGSLHAMPSYLDVYPNLRQNSLSFRDLMDLGRGGESFIRIPAVTLLAALVGVGLGWRRIPRWLPAALAALLLMAISLGASFHGRGEAIDIDRRMPYVWLIDHVKALWGCPRPTRYGMAAALLLALWMGVALSGAWAHERKLWRWIARAVSVAALVGMFAQSFHADPVSWYPPWPMYPQLADLEDDPVLLDLPVRFHGDKAIFSLFAYLRVPRINPPNNHLDPWRQRVDPDRWPLVYAADRLQRGEEIPEKVTEILKEEGPREIGEIGLAHVVVHNTQVDATLAAAYRRLLRESGATEVSRDASLTVWALHGPEGGEGPAPDPP